MKHATHSLVASVWLCLMARTTFALVPSALFSSKLRSSPPLSATAVPSETKHSKSGTDVNGYVPKWKKKSTVAETMGSIDDLGFDRVGLKGDIPVEFRQGNETRTSMAWVGQPYRDVATQAGQFIKYGCGKGECGTCECMVNGKWIRPCVATVPALSDAEAQGGKVIVQVKGVKSKSKSSGTFFSIRSFFMGFWNNLLGMIGFVKFIKAAKLNWEERIEYEELVRNRTKEIREARLQAESLAAAGAH